MEKLRLIIALLLLSIYSQGQSVNQQNYEFANGKWFDGQKFVARKFYTVSGQLTAGKPRRVDKTFDLAGKFIVPPFAEAHNHNLESEDELQERINKYLTDGVFYVKLLFDQEANRSANGKLQSSTRIGCEFNLRSDYGKRRTPDRDPQIILRTRIFRRPLQNT